MPALIPDDYLGDVHQRLLFYKRISNTDTQEKLDNIRMELIDRFGIPPQSVKQLFSVHQLRLRAEQLWITKVDGIVMVAISSFHQILLYNDQYYSVNAKIQPIIVWKEDSV